MCTVCGDVRIYHECIFGSGFTFLIFCFGSLHMQNFGMTMCFGLILQQIILTRLFLIIKNETDDLAECDKERVDFVEIKNNFRYCRSIFKRYLVRRKK